MAERMPEGVLKDHPMARLTTVRTGGDADFFARPSDSEALVELLAWARDNGIAIGMVGSGSNLLVSDDGFRGLAIKLDGELASIERTATTSSAVVARGCLPRPRDRRMGAGRTRVRHQHPGTAGGAVKMNANATAAGWPT
jgi:UDP-N-acetylmuramate dehydrogenase